MEKKLCHHGRLDTLEWYNKPLPELNVTLRSIRELCLPNNIAERDQLSFGPFPRSSKFAYFIEAGDLAWVQLEPLIQVMVDTGDVAQAFGPAAFIMDVPGLNPCIERLRVHHKHIPISMGYSIATTVIECSEVQLYDYEVKVKMLPVHATTLDGKLTNKMVHLKPLITKTTISQELQWIQFNGDQIFHTVVMVCKGPKQVSLEWWQPTIHTTLSLGTSANLQNKPLQTLLASCSIGCNSVDIQKHSVQKSTAGASVHL
jgi:hypothetical protein